MTSVVIHLLAWAAVLLVLTVAAIVIGLHLVRTDVDPLVDGVILAATTFVTIATRPSWSGPATVLTAGVGHDGLRAGHVRVGDVARDPADLRAD
jgi:hypothetical protein